MSKSETLKTKKEKELKEMIIVCILLIIACAVPGTILLVQAVGSIARKLTIRHYDRFHNFNTIWWHIEHALDPFML